MSESEQKQLEFLRIARASLDMLLAEAGGSPESRHVWQEVTNVVSTMDYIKGLISNEN
jgi:hypothetical protein